MRTSPGYTGVGTTRLLQEREEANQREQRIQELEIRLAALLEVAERVRVPGDELNLPLGFSTEIRRARAALSRDVL